MKKFTAIFLLLCIFFVSCAHKQIPFNKKQWMKEKNRFYMTDSLVEKLNDDKPNRSEIFDLLGKPPIEGRINDNVVSYWLKSEGFLTIWELAIFFDEMATMNLHVFIVKIRNKKRIKKIRHCEYLNLCGIEDKMKD